jgi:DNA repair exonuclease SbcCD ATPase subunit
MNITAHWIVALTCVPAITCGLAHADLNPSETRMLAIELGATPESLTALGFSLSTTQDALSRLAAQDQTASAMRQHQQQMVTLSATLASLNSQARAATDAAELQQLTAQINQTTSEVAAASAQAQTARAQLVAALIGSVADAVVAERVLRAGPVPAVYRVADLTDDQQAELRSALAAERHAQARGETPAQPVQQVLANYRSMPAIAQALGHQAGNLDAVRQLFMLMD